uniref:REJ domain-containing protein n=1 Tax=Heterorhabditis bacteriophora TaxID=37862 RepID=A0A1I7W8H8_HETBA
MVLFDGLSIIFHTILISIIVYGNHSIKQYMYYALPCFYTKILVQLYVIASVVAEPLVIILDAYTRLISVDSPLIIDASQSRDPNYYNQTVHHFWTCVNITTGKSLINEILHNYIPCVKKHLRIQALVRNIGWLNTSWEVLHTRDSGFFNISHFLQKPTTRFEKIDMIDSSEAVISLTIPPVEKQLSHSDLAIVTNAPPQLGVIEVAPQSGLVGISTLIEFSAGDGWKDDDSPVVYRFGLKTLLINNRSNTYWFPLTGSSSYQVYLPSANTESAGCNQRVGYTALLEVCDRLESCTQTESASFTVEKPKNLTIAIADLSISLNSDYGKETIFISSTHYTGNIFSALNKIYAMYMEQCNTIQDVTIADKVTSELLRSLGMNRLITVVSDFVLEEFITVLNRYRNLRGYLKPSTRKKRAIAQVYPVSEDEVFFDDESIDFSKHIKHIET